MSGGKLDHGSRHNQTVHALQRPTVANIRGARLELLGYAPTKPGVPAMLATAQNDSLLNDLANTAAVLISALLAIAMIAALT